MISEALNLLNPEALNLLNPEALNLLNKVNWLVSLVGAILLSIIGNLLTPLIKDLLDKKSEQKMNDKIKNLEQERDEIKSYSSNPLLLISYVNESLLKILVLFASASIFNSIYFLFFSQMFAAIFYYFAAMKAYKTLIICKKVKNFDKSITTINEQIKETEARLSNIDGNNN